MTLNNELSGSNKFRILKQVLQIKTVGRCFAQELRNVSFQSLFFCYTKAKKADLKNNCGIMWILLSCIFILLIVEKKIKLIVLIMTIVVSEEYYFR